MAKRGTSASDASRASRAGGRKERPDFHRQTVLFQWALSKLAVRDLDDFRRRFQISPDSREGVDERTGNHRFYEVIANALPSEADAISKDCLASYEQNILSHTQAINTGRIRHGQAKIDWKYHQYLALLLTELFLDRYFENPERLREEINERIEQHNNDKNTRDVDHVSTFPLDVDAREQLARLAFWCATGSGKTLLMHVNVRQFRHYHKQAESVGTWPRLDQIILVTPNDGLSRQHEEEFRQSGFEAVMVGEQGIGGLFAGANRDAIKILSIHKFQEDHGKTTVATEAFEGCNLVLVDEGHRGAGQGEEGKWMARRDQLAKGGFCMEYSATFKEAIGNDDGMRDRYARSVLFDYAYRSFYRDGYGKDFTILNLEDDDKQKRYLTAALLLFYQQIRVWKDGGEAIKPFLIDKPLWVFVGHTVVGKAEKNNDDRTSISDVVDVLLFFKEFLANPTASVELIRSLLEEGFEDHMGRDLLANRLPHIDKPGDKAVLARILHAGILEDVFHAPGGGQLAVQLLKGAVGELAVKVGESEAFGVVNVGDPQAVAEACDDHGVIRLEDDLNRESLFRGIGRSDSAINLLVGSRKFTEGWNSWRVSSIGLMRMGKSEGTQIIQLFGRGVRLRGYRMSLRRSSVLAQKPTPPRNLRQVETLQVFGVKASYMNTFRDWIFSEVPEAVDREIWDLPVVKNLPPRKLKTLQLKEEIEGEKVERGHAFRRLGPLICLRPPHPTAPEDAWLRSHPTRLNWLPRIAGIVGANKQITAAIGETIDAPSQQFTSFHIAMLDIDDLLFELETFKATRGLDRLHANWHTIDRLLRSDDKWYELSATDDDMRTDRHENRIQWQRMAQQLLNAYAERFHRFVRSRWEASYIEIADVDTDNLDGQDYTIETTNLVKSAEEIAEIAQFVSNLKSALEANPLAEWSHWGRQWRTVPFAGHLYQPLLYAAKNIQIKISPVPLDQHEAKFVEDLAAWCRASGGQEVYLLRNQAVTGLGFFQAANFFPDFLLWVQDDQRQHLAFVDPKGLVYFDPADPKIQFATRDIPHLQQIIDGQGAGLNLHAFILSNTPFMSLGWSKGGDNLMSKLEIEALGILFQADDPETYISSLMRQIIVPVVSPKDVKRGQAIFYLCLLLHTWDQPVLREAWEAALVFMLNDSSRQKVLSGIRPPKSATAGSKRQFLEGMDVVLSNLKAHGVIDIQIRNGRMMVSGGGQFPSMANAPTADVTRAEEAIQAVRKFGESRTAAEYAEVFDGEYALVE